MSNQSKSPMPYRERVLPSAASLWPALLIIPVSYLTLLPFSDKIGDFGGLGLGLLFTTAVLVSIWFASPVIQVDDEGFSVGDSTVPIRFLSGYDIVTADRAFEERGRLLDPAAYVRFQLSVNTLVKLEIEDPNDSTPYWLIATRNPQGVVDAIVAYR